MPRLPGYRDSADSGILSALLSAGAHACFVLQLDGLYKVHNVALCVLAILQSDASYDSSDDSCEAAVALLAHEQQHMLAAPDRPMVLGHPLHEAALLRHLRGQRRGPQLRGRPAVASRDTHCLGSSVADLWQTDEGSYEGTTGETTAYQEVSSVAYDRAQSGTPSL